MLLQVDLMQQAEWLAARMADLQALSLTVILDADAEVWRCVMPREWL